MTFTKDEINHIVKIYKDCVNQPYDPRSVVIKELAKHYDVSTNVIQGHLVAEGVYKKKEVTAKGTEMDKEGMCKAFEISFGVKLPSMRNMSKKDLIAAWTAFILISARKDADS